MEYQRCSMFIIVSFVSYINNNRIWGNAIYVSNLSYLSLCERGERGERGATLPPIILIRLSIKCIDRIINIIKRKL